MSWSGVGAYLGGSCGGEAGISSTLYLHSFPRLWMKWQSACMTTASFKRLQRRNLGTPVLVIGLGSSNILCIGDNWFSLENPCKQEGRVLPYVPIRTFLKHSKWLFFTLFAGLHQSVWIQHWMYYHVHWSITETILRSGATTSNYSPKGGPEKRSKKCVKLL